MHNFEDIEPTIEEYKKKIKLAESEMNFVQSTERSLKLTIQPRWVILFLVVVFFVVCIRAAINKRFSISTVTWVGVSVILVAYIAYVIVMMVRNKQFNKEISGTYLVKKEIYHRLQAEKRGLFEEYVLKTGGEIVEFADGNRKGYLWFEKGVLTIADLGDDIRAWEVEEEDINYISSDEKLSEYNKSLGNDDHVSAAVPFSYIFTKKETYIFSVESYKSIVKLLPEKELQKKLTNE